MLWVGRIMMIKTSLIPTNRIARTTRDAIEKSSDRNTYEPICEKTYITLLRSVAGYPIQREVTGGIRKEFDNDKRSNKK